MNLFLDGVRKGRPGREAYVGYTSSIFTLSATSIIPTTQDRSPRLPSSPPCPMLLTVLISTWLLRALVLCFCLPQPGCGCKRQGRRALSFHSFYLCCDVCNRARAYALNKYLLNKIFLFLSLCLSLFLLLDSNQRFASKDLREMGGGSWGGATAAGQAEG